MDDRARRAKAAAAVARAGISGEDGLAVEDGFRSSAWSEIGELVDLVVPGAALFRGARRTILVTDKQVHLFRGGETTLGRELAVYPKGPRALVVDRRKITLPEGQTIYMSGLDARRLAAACGVDVAQRMAEEVARQAGLVGEEPLLLKRGVSPKIDKGGTLKEWGLEVVIAGDLPRKAVGEARLVLVTDQNIYVFGGSRIDEPGSPLGIYPRGPQAFSVRGQRLIFGDGEIVTLDTSYDGKSVARAAGVAVETNPDDHVRPPGAE